MRRSLLLLLASLASALLVSEGVVRLLFKKTLDLPQDERSLAYRSDAELGWFPVPSSERTIEGTRTFHVRHNAKGFRDREPAPKSKPRVAVFGDSFVWGFDVEEHERFTEQLAARRRDLEVLNLGVSGYGTDQELLLLRRELAGLAPEVVVLLFASDNDRIDNTTNRRYGPYYKPYFRAAGSLLELRGQPVPLPLPYLRERSALVASSYLVRAGYAVWISRTHPQLSVPDPSLELVKAFRSEAEAAGARFALLVQGRDEPLLAFAQAEGIPAVSLVTRQRYPHFGGHWTPKGHQFVAEQLDHLLREKGWPAAKAGP
jgi:lysophospholipase L1-like esterase